MFSLYLLTHIAYRRIPPGENRKLALLRKISKRAISKERRPYCYG